MRDTIAKTEKTIRRMQKELEERENSGNLERAAVDQAFKAFK